MSKRSVAVEIAGQSYRIRSDADAASLHRLAAYVDRAMERVRVGTGTVDSLDVAVLTCLNLAREILSLRDREQNAGLPGSRDLRALIERVEAALPSQSQSEIDREGAAASATSPPPASGGASDPDASSGSPARTLELPTVESLRDRAAPRQESGPARSEADRSHGSPRIAAGGGGERAS
jgi:cell division protein ZapA (FtsZ GTPase activity inhibitor)